MSLHDLSARMRWALLTLQVGHCPPRTKRVCPALERRGLVCRDRRGGYHLTETGRWCAIGLASQYREVDDAA
jgi:Mn-dependent DtxR family transcriptional regulator